MNPAPSIYPVEEWRITEESPKPEHARRNATIFFLGNGYLGIRGGLEEQVFMDSPVHKGTYINGFYETEPITYGEAAYGFAREKQVMLNLADATEIRLEVSTPSGRERFSPDTGTLHSAVRYLDLRQGLLNRRITWESPGGTLLDIDITRMVSLTRDHLACIIYRVTPVREGASLVFRSVLNGETLNMRSEGDPRVGGGLPEDTLKTFRKDCCDLWMEIEQKTGRSGLEYACRCEHVLEGGELTASSCEVSGSRITNQLEVSAEKGTSVVLIKHIAYSSTREKGAGTPLDIVRRETEQASTLGAEFLLREHRAFLSDFWSHADVQVEGDKSLQQSIRFNLFALLQSAGRDGIRSIAAKGLSGEGYEGHYFWDTEIYVLPFLIYTYPSIARSLLLYRYSILDKARERAAVLSERGALFPWRTIAGEEASAYFPAGTAQYHINADIVYGIEKYVHATGDLDFLHEYGAEIAFETARLWISLGYFDEKRGGLFRLNCVTGPDEYTALVNNNAYTNIMARGNLEFAHRTAGYLENTNPDRWKKLKKRLSIEEGEPEVWLKAAQAMFIPYDRDRGIHLQDDSFLEKEDWDFEHTPPECYPLLLHYHPLVIYRHRVLKQPDVVLAMFLKSRHFSAADRRRNFLFYDPLTTGDSSLGPCVQSVTAAEIGDVKGAYEYFMKTARMDLDDVNRNVSDGIHTAAMAGTWISLVYGFGGMSEDGESLSFSPRLPRLWRSVTFRITFRGNELSVALHRNKVIYTLVSGEGLAFRHRGVRVSLCVGESRSFSLVPVMEAVLFDLDGVITDTAELHYRAWKRLADELGLPFNRKVNERLRGIGRRDSFLIILEEAGVTMEDRDIDTHVAVKNGYYRTLLADLEPKDILPGILEFLAELKREGIQTAMVSASRNARYILEKLDLTGAFDVFIDPEDVVLGKPDPEIFLTAAERLGVVPACCVGIEDAAAGIEAIREAGMFPVGIGPSAAAADLSLPDTGRLGFGVIKSAFNGK